HPRRERGRALRPRAVSEAAADDGVLSFDRPLDLARMRRERHARLVLALREQGLDAALLLRKSNVAYATGARVPAADAARATHRPSIALVTADGRPPHLWTWFADGVPPELPPEHVHPNLNLEREDGARALLEVLPAGSVATDEYTVPLYLTLAREG